MARKGPAPKKFWRVVDEDSQSRYFHGDLLAGSLSERINLNPRGWENEERLERELINHLDWTNRQPTAFISVYSDEETAWAQAEMRIERGKLDVKIIEIDVLEARRRMEYRNIRDLATKWDVWIEKEAYNNSKHEWIFLHRIYRDAIVGTRKVK